MNILLVQPPKLPGLKSSRGTIPVALLHLASYLRTYGHTPHILDYSILPVESNNDPLETYWKLTLDKIEKTEPGLIGINCFTTMHFPLVKDIADRIKRERPALRICLGGSHPSLFPEDILKNCGSFDYIVIGEGEEQILALLNMFAAQKEIDTENIQAIAYRDRYGKVVVKERKSYLSSLEEMPLPAWDLIDLKNYYADHSNWHNPKGFKIELAVPILTSRSCPFNCTFCSAKVLMGRTYRMRLPVKVVDEIELLNKQYNQNYFSFIDDSININKGHIIEICNEICKRGLDIQIAVSQGVHIPSLDEEVIDALDSAGCVTLCLPIESGSEYIRNSIIGKNLKSDKIINAVEYLKKKKIMLIGLFIMGFPEDTIGSLEETVDLIKTLSLDVNAVSTLVPFPGTKIFDQAKRDNLLLFDYTELWRGDVFFDPQNKEKIFIKPYNLSVSQLMEYRRLFNSMYFYSDRAKMLNKIV